MSTPEKPKCCQRIFGSYATLRVKSCSRYAVVERDGKPYCRQHDPVRVKAAQEKRDEVYRKQSEERQRVYRLQQAAPDLLEALEGIASATCEKWEMSYADFKEQFMPWARNVALAALKKAKGKTK